MRPSPCFSTNFVWGAATASAQIEGAWNTDGRGPSIWDRFCKLPDATLHGDNTENACDFYHRYADDVALMQEIGLQAFRFSVSWSRVLPEGRGAINQPGLDFYSRLVDALLERNIQPYLTLYHWDLPDALQGQGGWLNRDIADWFTDYSVVMADALGDRVKHWITFNEPQIFIGHGHAQGIHAPGLKLPDEQVMMAAHHVNLAHGRSVQQLRKLVPDAQMGMAVSTWIAIPTREDDPSCVAAARKATLEPEWYGDARTYLHQAWWTEPTLKGRYPDLLDEKLPGFRDNLPNTDLGEIHQPLDFFGFNYYFGRLGEAGENGRWREDKAPVGSPRSMFDWPLHPRGLYWASRFFFEAYQLPLYVFENGLSSMDWVGLDGKVHDAQRIDYLARHLREVSLAGQDGVELAGYFHWSLMDNFEWAQGYQERFGLIHIDYETQQRTLKDSAHWYGEVIKENGETLWPG